MLLALGAERYEELGEFGAAHQEDAAGDQRQLSGRHWWPNDGADRPMPPSWATTSHLLPGRLREIVRVELVPHRVRDRQGRRSIGDQPAILLDLVTG